MTAHAPKAAVVNPDMVRRFARYLANHPAWGVFHNALEDGNLDDPGPPYGPACEPRTFTREEDELLAYFRLLTPSQRDKLGRKASRMLAREPWELDE